MSELRGQSRGRWTIGDENIRNASNSFDLARFDKVDGLDLLGYGTQELHFTSTEWRCAALLNLRHSEQVLKYDIEACIPVAQGRQRLQIIASEAKLLCVSNPPG